MHTICRWICRTALWRDQSAQDLVEYALLAGLAAAASGLFLPGITESMDTVYSRLASKIAEVHD